MLLQGNVGYQALGDGAPNTTVRFGRSANLIVDELNGRFYEMASRGLIYSAANQANQALSVLPAANSATTGFILNNPVGSNVQIALLDVCVALASAPAAASQVNLAANASAVFVIPTTLTAENVINNQLGNTSVGVAQVWNSAKLQTKQTIIRQLGGGPAATGSVGTPYIRDEIAGQIILLSGTNVALNSTTTAISVMGSMAWIERPL